MFDSLKNKVDTFGIRKLLMLGGSLGIVFVLLLQLSLGWHLLRAFTQNATRLIFRDSASVIANQVLVYSSREANLQSSLNAVQQSVASLDDDAVVLAVVGGDGRFLAVSGSCTPTPSSVPPSFLAALTSLPLFVSFSEIQAPCVEELELCSAAPLDLEDHPSALLLFRRPWLSAWFSGSRSFLRYLTFLLPSIAFLWASAGVFLHFFGRGLLKHIRILQASARRFSAGERRVRFQEGEFDEFSALASVFNRMADEEAERLEALEKDDEQRKHLAASIVHDLRTPLAAIEGMLDRLKADPSASADRARYTSLISSSLLVQQEIAENLEQLSRMDADKIALNEKDLDLGSLIEALVRQLRSVADAKQIHLSFETEISEARLAGDEVLLRRLMLNLLGNALRYTPHSGSVTVTLRGSPESPRIEVRDTGIGISSDELPKIFKEYFRADAARRRSPEGAGLGLTVVERVARLHRADVSVDSKPGEGTAVSVHFNKARYAEEVVTIPAAVVAPKASDRSRDGLDLSSLQLIILGVAAGCSGVFFAPGLGAKMLGAVGAACFFGLLRKIKNSWVLSSPAVLLAALPLASLRLFPEHALVSAFGGSALSAVLFFLIRKISSASSLAIASAAFLLFIPLRAAGMYLLGFVVGVWFSVITFFLDRRSFSKRVAARASAMVFFFAITATVAHGISLFVIMQKSKGDAAYLALRTASQSLGTALSRMQNISEVGIALGDAQLYNPSLGFVLFDSDLRPAIEIDVGPGVLARVPPAAISATDKLLFEEKDKISPFLLKAIWELQQVCSSAECFRLGILSPSYIAISIINRRFEVFMAAHIVLLSLCTLGIFSIVTSVLQNIVANRFKRMEEGLERYRNGEYSVPIGFTSSDELGELVGVLDELADRLPKLANVVAARNTLRRAFLKCCAAEVRRANQEVGNALAGFGDHGHLQPLSDAIKGQRSHLESLFELSRLELGQVRIDCIEFAIDEILAEEIEMASAQSGIIIESEMPEDSVIVLGDPERTTRILRYFLRFQCARSAQTGRMSVSLLYGELFGIQLSDSGTGLTDRMVKHLLEPLTSEAGDRLDGRGEYEIAVFSRHLDLMGGSLKLQVEAGGSLRVLIELPSALA